MNSFRLPLLTRVEGLRHLFVGRGPLPRPDPATLVGLLVADGATAPPLARLRQIHSNRCLKVDPGNGSADGLLGEGDVLMTSAVGIALGVATADCLPLIAADIEAPALAVVHAGWRGTLEGVMTRALEQMREELGARPDRIVIGAGPAVGACCYRVGDEVISAFFAKYPRQMERIAQRPSPGVTHLDLFEANRLQALDAGVDASHIESVGVCTVCNPHLTHSYRRDGDRAGRMWALAMLGG